MGGFEILVSGIRKIPLFLAHEPAFGIAAFLLSGVFAWSGFMKIKSPARAALAIADFRVMRRPRPYMGVLLGALELGASALILLNLSGVLLYSRVGFLIAVVLLWTFTLLVARSLLTGERFPCFCFGNEDSVISPATLLRTVALAVLATNLALAKFELSGVEWTLRITQALVGFSLLSIAALAGRLPKLLQLNRDPFLVRREAPSHERS